MPASRPLLMTAVALLLLSGALLVSMASGWSKNEHAMGECMSCHLRDPGKNPDWSYLLLSTQERLCAECHPDAIQVSHPSGFEPNRDLPAHYPVDWSGNLTCSTCHEVHGSGDGLLHGDRQGKSLCLDCHSQLFFMAMRDGGRSIETIGHSKVDQSIANVEFDTFSLKCMECHGDKSARKRINLDLRGVVRHRQDALNHPIGMTYANYVSYGGYRKQDELADDILLPDGKVGCISCHQGYTKEHGQLVEGNYKNDLCYECHAI